MRLGRRIRTIYFKELLEILRDRRTLIAMVIVPIALYPLLIIGSVHLLSIQDDQRAAEEITIAVEDPSGGESPADPNQPTRIVKSIIKQVEQICQSRAEVSKDDESAHRELNSVKRMKVAAVPDAAAAVARGEYSVGVVLNRQETGIEGYPHLEIALQCDNAEIASQSACRRVSQMLETLSEALSDRFLENFQIPRAAVHPIDVTTRNVASPQKVGGMVLGSIIPLVLVLMTITGAIYPAIDLTAGERERGTLETILTCPVPPMELITGKYLVVTTIAMLGAMLNLGSVGATLYFGGFTEAISRSGETELPLGVLPVILLALIPFALLFSAVMVAVCSYARTFKEAQNYIMPVILAALIPGGVAAMPGTSFSGVNTVVPVMNMVLLARELLLGHWEWTKIALVLVSTSLYAAAAVGLASRVFSTETVVFADTASMRSLFSRRLMRPAAWPSPSMVLIVTSLLFPTWIFVQGSLQPGEEQTLLYTFMQTAWLMPVFFVVIPALVMGYWKVDIVRSLNLRAPPLRHLLGAVLIGCSAWVLAHELFLLQQRVLPVQGELPDDSLFREAFADRPIWLALLLIAFVPPLCEELFFRGFLLSGLRGILGQWRAILVCAVVFSIFHVALIKFAVTASLGVLLGYLCWQSRSVWPAIVAHGLHNGSAVLLAFWPKYKSTLRLTDKGDLDHLPLALVIGSGVLVAVGIGLCVHPNPDHRPPAPEGTGEPHD